MCNLSHVVEVVYAPFRMIDDYSFYVMQKMHRLKPILFIFLIGNDLESIKTLFSEKEKELSMAVTKVEALTRQLEDVRRDRRASLLLMFDSSNTHNCNDIERVNVKSSSLEIDTLHCELMVSLRYL